MKDKTSLGISDLLRQYIEALVEEVVLEGKPFDNEMKKWLQRYSQKEGVDYATLEKNLTDFFEVMEEWKTLKSKSSQLVAKMLAANCFLSEAMMDKLSQNQDNAGKLPLTIKHGVVVRCSDSSYKGSIKIPTVFDGVPVTSIAKHAFRDCEGVTSIIIPNSITSIEENTFSGCSALTTAIISNSVKKIGNNAFQDCSKLTSITLPDSLIEIGEGAFRGCLRLSSITIPDSVTIIGKSAFEKCERLASVTILNPAIKIGPDVFKGCVKLKSVNRPTIFETTTDNPSQHYRISYGSLYGTKFIEGRVELPSVINGQTVNRIGDSAFARMGIDSVVIPNTVTKIGSLAFENCQSMKVAVVPDSVTDIGVGAFRKCRSLTRVDLSDNLRTIEPKLFAECASLTHVDIPASVSIIRTEAFRNCPLQKIVIPDSVTMIEDLAFYYCRDLSSITMSKRVVKIGRLAFGGCCALKSIIIPNSVKFIEPNAFVGCDNLKELTIGHRNHETIKETISPSVNVHFCD